MGGKYYAVVSGVVPDIYTDWPTAEKMVKGFPGAIFKSFHTKAEAEAFMQKSTVSVRTDKPHVLPLIDKSIIYTDGTYKDGKCGFGVVIIMSNGDKYTACGKVPQSVTLNVSSNNVAELYAMYVGLSLIKGDVILYSDSQYGVSCLTSYIHSWIQNGWNGVANRNLIEGIYNLMQGRNVMIQHVLGHSGIQLNEEADRLASEGLVVGKDLIVKKNGQSI